MAERPTVGFVGVGNMGAPMALNLAKAGYGVCAFDTRPDTLTAAAEEHALISAAKSVAEVGQACSVVITMLPDSRVVTQVVLGTEAEQGKDASAGLAAAMTPGSIIIDMSSSFPPETQKLARKLRERNIALVDAPVSGGVPKAISGQLAIMAGGNDDDVNKVVDVLETMGRVFRTGAVGSGHAMKALNNYLSAVGLIATSEALVVGQAFGLDPHRMVEVLNASTGRNNTTENKAARYMLSGEFNAGFTLGLLAKDVGMAENLAKSLDLDTQVLHLTAAYLKDALSELGGASDHTEVFRFVSEHRRTASN